MNNVTCKMCANSISNSCNTICYAKSKEFRRIFAEKGLSAANDCIGFSITGSDAKGIVDNDKALKFITSGNAEFILFNNRTKRRDTFKVEKVTTKDNRVLYFVCNGTIDCTVFRKPEYCLRFDSTENKFELFNGRKDCKTDILIDLLNSIYNKEFTDKYTIYHRGKCGKCGRGLRADNKSGLGPICEIK